MLLVDSWLLADSSVEWVVELTVETRINKKLFFICRLQHFFFYQGCIPEFGYEVKLGRWTCCPSSVAFPFILQKLKYNCAPGWPSLFPLYLVKADPPYVELDRWNLSTSPVHKLGVQVGPGGSWWFSLFSYLPHPFCLVFKQGIAKDISLRLSLTGKITLLLGILPSCQSLVVQQDYAPYIRSGPHPNRQLEGWSRP